MKEKIGTRLGLAGLLAVMICCCLPGLALGAEGTPSWRQGEGYTAVLYDSTSGLPTSDVNALVQSPEGFIWIGSYSGLIRYDGNEFYRYDSSTGVSSVVSLYVDSRQRVWIGTNDSGVGVLEGDSFRFYDREEGLRSSSVRSMMEDPAGNILVATTMGMAYIDPEGELHVLDDPQINREYVCELVRGEDGVIYCVTNEGAFFTIEELRLTGFYSSESLGYGIINTVYPDPQRPGWIYLGTQSSSVVYGELSRGLAGSQVYSIGELDMVNSIRELNGLLWVCSDSGIGYFEPDHSFTQLEDLPMSNSIEHIMADHEGNLWFTSSRQGMMKLVENRFLDISRQVDLPVQVVNSTCLRDGLLYIGADTGLTILNPDGSLLQNELTELLRGVRIRCIKQDSGGGLWFCTNSDRGLVYYRSDTGEYRSYNQDSGLASNRARTILERRDGSFAVATNAGVNLLENGEITSVYNKTQGISNLEILCLEEDSQGRLYFGSDGDGIYVLEGDKISRLGREDGLSSEVILRMRRDPVEEDLFWIITSNSLGYLREGHVTTIHHFPYSNNFDLYFDDDNRAWVLASNGIYVVKREDLLSDGQIDYTLYDTKSGLPCAATANSFSFLDEEDGTLYIAASKGVSCVNIFNDADNNQEVQLSVPFLYVDGAYFPVPEGGAVTIPASCRRLNINAYAFTYSLHNPHVRYSLEGFDQEPIECTKQELGDISYTNLAGGTYTFRLALWNTMTGETDREVSVSIVKEKTLGEQLWFRVLTAVFLAALAALAVALFYRHKTKRLLRKQAEHKQLINEMTSVFASCIDMKDAYTNGHSYRVAKYTGMLAKRLGKSEEEIEEMYNIALLHDIGKISIPDKVLNKPERLTEEEFQVMKTHSERGYEILKDITIDPKLSLGAGYHHERMDGKGYPRGLKGDEIPEIAQIIAVADTFDAMYSTRPYRKKLPLDTVAAEIEKAAGTQLSRPVVEAFMELVHEGAFDNE